MKSDVFAAVMATGIVSIAANYHDLHSISAVLAVVAILALPGLAVLAAAGWKKYGWDLHDIDTAMGLFTYVAACCVLAARFGEHQWFVTGVGGMALAGWASLAPVVARNLWRLRWTGLRDRAHGAWELVSVSTSGVAIVFAELDTVFWALIFWVLALAQYVAMTTVVCWRIATDPSMRRNVPPDHWILMGGMAIATLAGDHIHRRMYPGPIADAVHDITVVTWIVATLWVVPLAVVGWRRIRDWPAVFPLGMYSAATFATAEQTGWRTLVSVSLVFFWLAFVVWILTVAAIVISARWRSLTGVVKLRGVGRFGFRQAG